VAGAVFEAGVPTEKRCSRIATASRLIFTDLEQPEPSTLWKLRYRFWSRRNFQTLQNRRAAGIPVPGPFYNARRNDLCAVELGDGPYASVAQTAAPHAACKETNPREDGRAESFRASGAI